MNFHVGDKVKVLRERDDSSLIGYIGEIVRIDNEHWTQAEILIHFPGYRLGHQDGGRDHNRCDWWFRESHIIPARLWINNQKEVSHV